MNQPAQFTASQLAAALGKSKRTVLASLRKEPASGQVIVSGNVAATWSLASLPSRWRVELATARNRPTPTWKPSVPLAQVAQPALDKAAKLQRALARVLALQNDFSRTSGELEQLGLDDYRREFGFTISDRALRSLVKRTIERDGGAENWSRVELYLDERPARKAPLPSAPRPGDEVEFRELRDVLTTFKAPLAPTAKELDYHWLRAFEIFEATVAGGKPAKRTQRALVRFLFAVMPSLAKHEAALRKTFKRKLARWQASERRIESVADQRAENSGFNRAPKLPDADRMLLTAAAAKFGGGVEQAWEMCHGKMSPAIREYYPGVHRCPTLIRETIRHDVAMAKIALHGPNAMRTAGAYVNRDPSGIASGDWDQSDDMTMVNEWWDDAPELPEGFWLGQGQLLIWVDERSWFAYAWNLISDPYYDGFSIRNSWNTKAETWGLPRKGLSLERGIWKTARIVVGDKVNRTNAVGILETASAIERLGLRFHNATHARVKVIERIYGKLQNYFQAAPGYVGRNPITDRYERVQEQIRMVKAGKAHPSEFFLHKSQWAPILDKVLMIYNDTPMHGKYHNGRSPKQVFEQEFSDKLVHIPDELAHMFKPECFERPVTANGVKLSFGKRGFIYKGARLGELRGQRVKIYFDPANPEIARCTDLRGMNPFVAELEQPAFNHDPAPGTLEKAIAQNAAQDRYMKELHRSLKPYYNSEFFSNLFRPVQVDLHALMRADAFSKQTAEITTRRNEQTKQQGRVRKIARALGLRADLLDDSTQTADAVALVAEARRERERERRAGVESETTGEA